MHLIAKATAKIPMPSILPIELLRLKPKNSPEVWSAFDNTTSQSLPNEVLFSVNYF